MRVVRREHVFEGGPAADDAELFRLLADLVADGQLEHVDTVVTDWRDDGYTIRWRDEHGHGRAPRAPLMRSSINSRIIAMNFGCVPTVAARTMRRPNDSASSRAWVSRSNFTSM